MHELDSSKWLWVKDCPSLVELHLADNKIEEEGVQALSSCFANLKGLDLSNNVIAAAGAKVLANNLKHCTKLNWLNLSGNILDRKAALAIISSIKQCSSFKELILCRNRITDPQTLSANLHKGSLIYNGVVYTHQDKARGKKIGGPPPA